MPDTHDYARLLENAPVGILRSEEGGRILAANPALVESGRPIEAQAGDGGLVYESFVEDVTEESESRKALERVLGSSGAILFRLSVKEDGPPRAQWISRSVQSILGYTLEEALQPDWWPTGLHPDDRTATIERMAEVFEDGRTVQEYRFRRKGGSYAWLRDESRLLRDDGGNPEEIVGVWTDVTERRRAEQALDRVLHLSGAILIRLVLGEEGVESVWVSESVEEVLGYRRDETLEPGWWAAGLHPDDRADALEAESRVLEEDDVVFEYRFRTADGDFLWFREELHLIRGPSGTPREIVGVGIDITAAKEREEALRASEERFRRLTEAAPDAIVAADAEGTVVVANPAAERMFGYAASEMVGRHFTLLFPERFREMNRRVLERMLAAGGPETVPPRGLLGRRKDGSEFPAEVAISTDPHGGQLVVTAIIRDLTQRLELEAERDLLRSGLLGGDITERSLISICSGCKNIRDDDGGWHPVEIYVRDRAPIEFSHGIGPSCLEKLYGDLP